MTSLTAVVAWGLLVLGGAPTVSVPPPCSAVSVGIDLSQANAYAGAILGEGLMQTFAARDTLISSITVWRPSFEDSLVFPFKLWVLPVSAAGVPQSGAPIFESADLDSPFGDGIHPTLLQQVFNPPLALSSAGTYAFAIQNVCAGTTDLVADSSDGYAAGQLWISARSSFSGCGLVGATAIPRADLIFSIDFCDTSTPVRLKSWGEVKVRYR